MRALLLALPWAVPGGCGTGLRRIAAPAAAEVGPAAPYVDHEARHRYLLGRLHLERGELDLARQALAEALRHDRDSAWIRVAQGDVELAAGAPDLARQRWAEAVDRDPDCGPAWLRLARLDRVRGDLPASRRAYEEAVRAGEGWQARSQLVDLLVLMEEPEAAGAAIAAWVQSGEAVPPWGLQARSEARLAIGDRAGAWEDLRAYLEQRPEAVEALDLFLLLTDSVGRRGSAQEVVERMARTAPTDLELARRQVAFYEGVGNPLRLAAALARLARLEDAPSPELHLDRARALGALGRSAEALAALDAAEAVDPRWPLLALERARALHALGRSAEARAVLRQASPRPDEVPARAILLRALGEVEAAGRLLDEALADAPEARPLLLAALRHAAATGDAARGASLAARLASDAEGLWIVALRQEGRRDEAAALLRARADQGDPLARRDLAALVVRDDPAAAAALLRQTVAALPADRHARYLLAAALLERGLEAGDRALVDEARALARALLAELPPGEPGDVGALNLLAWSYAEGGDDVARAVELARGAVELDPADPHVLDTLGWALARDGQRAAALPVLEEAAALAPDAPEIAAHLAAARAGALPAPALAGP